MLQRLLPERIYQALENVKMSNLCEVRLRVDMPVIVNVAGKLMYLNRYGASVSNSQAIICGKKDIENIILSASNNALYSINDQLVRGYISVRGGIRIGVAGEFVHVNGDIKTVKNIQALNIRIPHEVRNCSLRYFRHLQHGTSIYNTLILSPAGGGKTTFIRDLSRQLLANNNLVNLLIVDERCEITGISSGKAHFEGFNCDILSHCTKHYAFDNGIRSLRPDIIVTDELSGKDIDCVRNAITCGVKVVATMHAESILDLKYKPEFSQVLEDKLFDRFVLLGCSNGIGEACGVYDSNLECIGV